MAATAQHPEWEKEHSLTSPTDRDRAAKWRPEQGKPSLANEEVIEALQTLNNNDFTSKFPRIDRTYADPPVTMQNIGLVSFTPAKGATPNKNGVFGFAKLRGNYQTELEADQRAEWLIRNADSYHQIYHTYVGRPFPITASSDYSAETSEIDIRKETTAAVSSAIKKKKDRERREVQEVKDREEALLAESRQDPEDADPYEEYITLRVKKAQLSWTYLEHIKKMKEIKGILLRTRDAIEALDAKDPEYQTKYYAKYIKAREEAGIKETAEEAQSNFMQYLVEDVALPGLDTDTINMTQEETQEESREA